MTPGRPRHRPDLRRVVTSHSWRACLAALVLAAAGCSELHPQVAYPQLSTEQRSADEAHAQDALLDRLREQDRRVAAVAYRLATASLELCAEKAPQTGLVLSSARQFSPRLRAVARRALGLGDGVSIEAVAPGTPAARSGLREGDELMAVGGAGLQAVGGDPDRAPANYTGVASAQAALDQALAHGPVTLTLRRGAELLSATLASEPGCGYDVQVLPSRELNASADGRHVFITTALLRYAVDDDTLAVVLGHEFAHDVLHHRLELDQAGIARGVLGPLGSNPASQLTAEREADYVGLYLTARAGYDISAAPQFWARLAADYGDAWYVRLTHPGSLERAASLEATEAEILAKLKAGQPLRPNPAR